MFELNTMSNPFWDNSFFIYFIDDTNESVLDILINIIIVFNSKEMYL